MIHEIQMTAGAFSDVITAKKTHVMQKYDDAQYSVGDFLALNETTPADGPDPDAVEYTGRCCLVRVAHICAGSEKYLTPGTIIMTVRPCVIGWPDFGMQVHNRSLYAVETYDPGEGATP